MLETLGSRVHKMKLKHKKITDVVQLCVVLFVFLCYPKIPPHQKLIKTLNFLPAKTQDVYDRKLVWESRQKCWRVKLNKWGCGITLKQMQWIKGGAGHTRPGSDSLHLID